MHTNWYSYHMISMDAAFYTPHNDGRLGLKKNISCQIEYWEKSQVTMVSFNLTAAL